MSYSTPDTNILIFETVGGHSYQQEQAETYFELIRNKETKAILLHEVDLEFYSVIKKRISETRKYALKATQHKSWEKASDYTPDNHYAENFAESLKERAEPQNAIKELNKWKRSIKSQYRRRKKKFKKDSERKLDSEKTNKIENQIPDKKHSNEETRTDAKIIQSSFLHSHEHNRNLAIISDDKHILNTEYPQIETIMNFTDYQHEITSNRPQKYLETIKN